MSLWGLLLWGSSIISALELTAIVLFSNRNNGEPNVDRHSSNNGDTNDAHESHRLSEEINNTCFIPYISAPSSLAVAASPSATSSSATFPVLLQVLWTTCYPLLLAQLYKTQYNVTLVSSDGDIVAHKTLPLRVSETSSSKQSDDEGLISPHESHFHFNFPNSKTKSQPFLPYHASTSKQGENHPTMSESSSKNKTLSDDHNISSAGFSEVNLVMRMPLQLSWEMVKEITSGFTRMTCFEENENFKTYCGYLSDHHSQVLVRRFTGQLDYVLKAAKKAALSMHHKNILGLSGYYKGKNGTVLVYLFTQRWTLDRFLHDSMGKQWTKMTFQEKIKIAIGICDGVRYMHEECPRGPVVCGDLRSCNIFMNFDLEPQVLARPLLLQRAFHKLLDKDMEDLDIYEIFRIISVLKGETSCAMQLSPSLEGSPNMDFSGSSICRLVCNLTSELSLSE
ncbi:unnamed protein product [Camellia sinensis]